MVVQGDGPTQPNLVHKPAKEVAHPLSPPLAIKPQPKPNGGDAEAWEEARLGVWEEDTWLPR